MPQYVKPYYLNHIVCVIKKPSIIGICCTSFDVLISLISFSIIHFRTKRNDIFYCRLKHELISHNIFFRLLYIIFVS